MLFNALLSTLQPPPPTNYGQDSNIIVAWITIGIAVLFGVVISTIVAAIYYTVRKQRTRKEIFYEVISDAPIANINKEVKDKVEIRFDGKAVSDIRLLVIEIWNSGNVAVAPEDFVEPIRLDFKGRIVVGADVLSMEPNDLISSTVIKSFFTLEPESVELQKFQLNPEEVIRLKMLITGPQSEVRGKARIRDGKLLEYLPVTIGIFTSLVPIFFQTIFFLISIILLLFVLSDFIFVYLEEIINLLETIKSLGIISNIIIIAFLIFYLISCLVFIIFSIFVNLPQIKRMRRNGIRFSWY